ncbi:phytanoyl-CoA dioxygenase family protein [Sphingomonas sp.]|jgi:hypothetical protein|uniref:phytanoyl-CoA dioxygenase family protein n=1 Tax=Sphingomonas sp. TaxID=28214 RepID=UPI002E2F2B8B|nr:phytanoyl-CoA dioxygenase family protein [Sphingomonas sp.]HEX4694649.1 phytanoyl-CoA dioxygenase family protein [Sphingomonas sp.]
MLTRAEASRFQTDGFVVPKYRLSTEALAWLREAVADLVAANSTVPLTKLVLPRSARPEANPFGVVGHHALNRFAENPEFVALASAALDCEAVLWGAQVFSKAPASGARVPWHQDAFFWPIGPPNACTLWIAVDQTTHENGCVQAISSSHRAGLLPHDTEGADGNFSASFDPSPAMFSNIVDLLLKPGEVSLHHSLLVHGSGSNFSGQSRTGFAVRFMDARARFVHAHR